MAQHPTPAAGSGTPHELKALWAYELAQMSGASVHNQVPSQPLQASAVCRPVSRTLGGDAPIVVKLYSLGRGVAVKGQGDDLSGREGAFELETHREPLVFYPLGARTAEWQVSAVEGDVAPIGLPIEAVHQEQLAEVGNGGTHGNPPVKTVILSLPPALGKSTVASQLAQRLGCTSIVDEWHPGLRVLAGALHLTNCEVA